MIRNYLRTAMRALWRQKSYSLLNILGLAISLAAGLLILAYVREDLRWDGFHDHGDRIQRVVMEMRYGGSDPRLTAFTMPGIAPAMKQELPEVVDAVRSTYHMDLRARTPDMARPAIQEQVRFVDPSFLTVFSFELLRGDPATALARPDGAVITRKVAERFFGDRDPMGRTLRMDETWDAVVTGIVAEPPAGTHIPHQVLLPFEAYRNVRPGADLQSWGWFNFATYILLADNATAEQLCAKMDDFFAAHTNPEEKRFHLQPLSEIHLDSGQIPGLNYQPGGRSTVYALTSIAVFLMLIAAINFMNLATALASRRAREVGMRKVVGARRRDLVVQFMGEAFVIALLSMLLAVLIIELAQPWFEQLAGRSLPETPLDGGPLLLILLGMTAAVGLLSGLYPAFVLSSFRPTTVFKGDLFGGRRGAWVRRGLVVFQFSLSILLLIGMGVMIRQLDYSRRNTLHFSGEDVLLISGKDAVRDNLQLVRETFRAMPEVEAVTFASGVPGSASGMWGGQPEGSDESWMINYLCVDGAADDVFRLKVLEGRFFREGSAADLLTDSTGAYVINRAAMEAFGWADPVGRSLTMGGNYRRPVIGVVENFHHASLHNAIEPMVMMIRPGWSHQLALRFRTDNVGDFVRRAENTWEGILPDHPFSFEFLDDRIARLYRAEQQQGRLLAVFAGMAVFIALLGLLGLVAYALQRRRREIGVRKVLGASEGHIFGLVSREFTLLILAANLVAWPVAWWVTSRWLENFAYKASFGWWTFPAAGALTLAVALATCAGLVIRAARSNPARVLRDS